MVEEGVLLTYQTVDITHRPRQMAPSRRFVAGSDPASFGHAISTTSIARPRR